MKACCAEIEPSRAERRENPRFPFSSAVMFENYQTRTCHDGRMIDHSRTGMRFETGAAPEPGSEIFIGMDRSPYSAAHDVFRARVVWLQAQPFSYSVGVQYY
jgi:hypothetical protein